jgi:hypothetical protein
MHRREEALVREKHKKFLDKLAPHFKDKDEKNEKGQEKK